MLQENEEKVPIFRTWKGWYATVIIVLVLFIVLFLVFTRFFD